MSASQITAASPPTVLSIAGFDPSAGAGILADLKTFSASGVYGAACITALTVQSTTGVRRVEPLDPRLIVETLDCLAEDLGFSAIKVGMLGNGAIAAAVAGWLRGQTAAPVVLDPILQSSSGHDLLDSAGIDCLRQEWLELAQWITPNLPELAVLTGEPEPGNRGEAERLARRLQTMATERGNPGLRVLVTGGHAEKPDDLLLTEKDYCRWFRGERVCTPSTHGTGCAFSSALAARIALGDGDAAAVQAAKEYVAGALRSAFPVGRGKGPLNHAWNFSR